MSTAASHLRPLEPDTSLKNLRTAVETDYAPLSYNQRNAKPAELHIFLNRLTPHDVAATTSESRVYVGRIARDAMWQPGEALTTIRRTVELEAGGSAPRRQHR